MADFYEVELTQDNIQDHIYTSIGDNQVRVFQWLINTAYRRGFQIDWYRLLQETVCCCNTVLFEEVLWAGCNMEDILCIASVLSKECCSNCTYMLNYIRHTHIDE